MQVNGNDPEAVLAMNSILRFISLCGTPAHSPATSEGIPHGVFAWMAAHHDLRLHGAISAESVWELAGPSSNCSIVPGAPESLHIRWPKRIHLLYTSQSQNGLTTGFLRNPCASFEKPAGEEDGSILLSSVVASFKAKDSQARNQWSREGVAS